MGDFEQQIALLTQVAIVSMTAILSAFAIIVAWQLLTGRINTNGLFRDKVTGGFSPARVQLMLLTLYAAGAYLQEILTAENMDALPEPSNIVLGLLGGSGTIYLGGKSGPVIGQLVGTIFRR